MIAHFPRHILIRIWIPARISPLFFRKASFFSFLILTQFICCACSSSFAKNLIPDSSNIDKEKDPESETMKIHPLPMKRNITIQFDVNPSTNIAQAQSFLTGGSRKKLRRLPHVFSRVLVLPFRADAEVEVEESADCFKFVAETDGISDVRAQTVEIHPGVIKILIRPGGHVDLASLDDLEFDMWRFRLPESTRPELASAVYEDGELIVTVPKDAVYEDVGGGEVLIAR
ncbi:hypothetical protein SLA2020_500660 [Shorea laevis]